MKEARDQILDIFWSRSAGLADRVWMWGKVLPWKICGGRGQTFGKSQQLVSPGERHRARCWEWLKWIMSPRLALTCASLGREEDVLSSWAVGRQLLLLPWWLSCCIFSMALLIPASFLTAIFESVTVRIQWCLVFIWLLLCSKHYIKCFYMHYLTCSTTSQKKLKPLSMSEAEPKPVLLKCTVRAQLLCQERRGWDTEEA